MTGPFRRKPFGERNRLTWRALAGLLIALAFFLIIAIPLTNYIPFRFPAVSALILSALIFMALLGLGWGGWRIARRRGRPSDARTPKRQDVSQTSAPSNVRSYTHAKMARQARRSSSEARNGEGSHDDRSRRQETL